MVLRVNHRLRTHMFVSPFQLAGAHLRMIRSVSLFHHAPHIQQYLFLKIDDLLINILIQFPYPSLTTAVTATPPGPTPSSAPAVGCYGPRIGPV